MTFNKFIKNCTTSAPGIMALGLFSTIIIFISYNRLIKSKIDEKKRIEAKNFANYIYDKEIFKVKK